MPVPASTLYFPSMFSASRVAKLTPVSQNIRPAAVEQRFCDSAPGVGVDQRGISVTSAGHAEPHGRCHTRPRAPPRPVGRLRSGRRARRRGRGGTRAGAICAAGQAAGGKQLPSRLTADAERIRDLLPGVASRARLIGGRRARRSSQGAARPGARKSSSRGRGTAGRSREKKKVRARGGSLTRPATSGDRTREPVSRAAMPYTGQPLAAQEPIGRSDRLALPVRCRGPGDGEFRSAGMRLEPARSWS